MVHCRGQSASLKWTGQRGRCEDLSSKESGENTPSDWGRLAQWSAGSRTSPPGTRGANRSRVRLRGGYSLQFDRTSPEDVDGPPWYQFPENADPPFRGAGHGSSGHESVRVGILFRRPRAACRRVVAVIPLPGWSRRREIGPDHPCGNRPPVPEPERARVPRHRSRSWSPALVAGAEHPGPSGSGAVPDHAVTADVVGGPGLGRTRRGSPSVRDDDATGAAPVPPVSRRGRRWSGSDHDLTSGSARAGPRRAGRSGATLIPAGSGSDREPSGAGAPGSTVAGGSAGDALPLLLGDSAPTRVPPLRRRHRAANAHTELHSAGPTATRLQVERRRYDIGG